MDLSNTKRTQPQKVDFLQELKHQYEYGLIATFNLDPQFLEDYLLGKVGAFSGCSYLTILMDATQYEILSSSLDQQVKQLNRRYLLVPIQVPGSFHAKVYIFASKKTGLLILGSANLTRAGLTRNAELVYTYRYDQDKDKKNLSPLFQQAFSFFVELQRKGLAHSKSLEENIERMANEVPWLPRGIDLSIDPKPFRFIHNLEKPIIRQLVTDPSFTPIEAHFLSPYFDQSPNLIERLSKASGAQSLSFYTQNGTTTLNPEWVSSAQGKAANAKFYLVEYEDDGRLQNLHGKAIVLTDKARFALYYGSANCTSQGLFTSSESGNIETGLLLLGYTRELGDLRRLFVTGDNRITPLTSPDDLHISPERESPEPSPKHLITIWEAELDGNKLHIRTSVLPEVEAKELIVVVERGENDFYSLSPEIYEGETLKAKCPGKVLNWLNTQTCVVYLGSKKNGNVKVLSNRVFVVNLSDPETGRNLRESRLLRDARLGYGAFLGVLDRLAGDKEDIDQLIKFLTLCEIPFNERFSPFGLGHERVFNPSYSEELRTLGRRAIKLFQSVHQAAIFFIDRHQKRLEKHVTNGSTRGVPNFMHMFLSMGYVIQNQLEKLVNGLESLDRDFTPDEWFRIRKEADLYYFSYDRMMNLYAEKYVVKFRDLGLMRVKDLFVDSYEDVRRLNIALRGLSDRLEKARRDKFKILTILRTRVAPPTSDEHFAPSRLNYYLSIQDRRIEMVEQGGV